MRSAPLAWALLLLGAPRAVRAQQLTPFQGQGVPPAGGAEVFVSVVVDRLLNIDDRQYQFEVRREQRPGRPCAAQPRALLDLEREGAGDTRGPRGGAWQRAP